MQEDEVQFEKIDEDPVTVATTSTTLTPTTIHNVIVLDKKFLETESENLKLKDEIIILGEEMKKKRKVDDSMIPLKENILEHKRSSMM